MFFDLKHSLLIQTCEKNSDYSHGKHNERAGRYDIGITTSEVSSGGRLGLGVGRWTEPQNPFANHTPTLNPD